LNRFLKEGINLLANLSGFYTKSDLDIKRDLISSIFPEKLFFSENRCRTPRINEVLSLFLTIDKGKEGMKKMTAVNFLPLSPLVELEGVEPTPCYLR
jgi:hypothetical protein